jgi:hypothetical protein
MAGRTVVHLVVTKADNSDSQMVDRKVATRAAQMDGSLADSSVALTAATKERYSVERKAA